MDQPITSLIWEWFHDSLVTLQIHSVEDARKYLGYLNTNGRSSKIEFTIQTENKNDLESLDLRLTLRGSKKIKVHVYSKPTNSMTYIDAKTCY